jgi:small subunit ribosomal protein S10
VFFLPKPHGIPSAVLHLRSHYIPLLKRFTNVALHAAAALGIPASQPAMLPTQRTLWTVPKSPFVHKAAQENFERKVHKRAIKVWDADPEVVERWVRFLDAHSEGGVGMRVVRWERAPVGIGREALRKVEERFMLRKGGDSIKRLGEKIVEAEGGVPAKEEVVKATA